MSAPLCESTDRDCPCLGCKRPDLLIELAKVRTAEVVSVYCPICHVSLPLVKWPEHRQARHPAPAVSR